MRWYAMKGDELVEGWGLVIFDAGVVKEEDVFVGALLGFGVEEVGCVGCGCGFWGDWGWIGSGLREWSVLPLFASGHIVDWGGI